MRKELTYELAHVGINLDETGALETAGRLAELFQLETRKGGKSYFAGDMFECIRIPFRGTHGHIGLRVSDMQAAMADLEEQGVTFYLDETTEYDEQGQIVNVYLHGEFGGFAIHIMQK